MSPLLIFLLQARLYKAKQSLKKIHAAHAVRADILGWNFGHFDSEITHICHDFRFLR